MSSRRSGERPHWLDESLFPFQSRFLELDGCEVHYVDEGEGPPLLLLHGNPTWSFLYRNVIQALRPRFRCIALDYPGFGLSTAREGYEFTPEEHARITEQFILELDLSGATMMVHDWGGPIGLGAASRHPERFRALVIADTWAWPANGDPRFETFSRLTGGPVGHVLIRHLNAFVNLALPLGTYRKLSGKVMAAYRGPFPDHLSREPTYVFPREILSSREYLAGVERGLASLGHLPTLILWGGRDLAFRGPERARFERTFPDHRTRVIQRAGHFIQEDAPDEITEKILGWWR